MRLRRPAAMLGILGILLATAGCNPLTGSTAGSGDAVTVALVPGIDSATFALAMRRGLFASAGINVQMHRYATTGGALAALSGGHAAIAAVDYGDLFFADASASPIYKILADGYDAGPGVIEVMTLPNSPITSPAQLGGQKIALPNVDQVHTLQGAPTSLIQAAATSVLQNYGVNMTTVTWQAMSPRAEITALEQKKVAAILVSEPYVYQAQQVGATELLDACSGSTSGIPLSGYVTTDVWYREHPSMANAFRTAIEQAAELAAMPGPVQEVLPKYASMTKQQAALVAIGSYPTTTIAASLQRTADLMAVQGMIRFGLNVAAMIIRLSRLAIVPISPA